MNKRAMITAALIVLAIPTLTWAQNGSGVPERRHGAGRRAAIRSAFHASTANESYLRGLGAAYEGYGAGARDYAEGEVLDQQAIALKLQNDQTRIEMKRLAKERYEAAQAEIAEEHRADHEAERMARMSRGVPMAAATLNADGSILWPAELQGEELQSLRSVMDQLIADGALARNKRSNDLAVELSRTGELLCSSIASEVKQDTMPPTALLAARRLVKGLAAPVVSKPSNLRVASLRQE